MLNNIQAVIFDMDGTLIDSMWVWDKVDLEYLKRRNIQAPDNLRQKLEHLSFEESARYFKKIFKIKDSVEDIMNEWNDIAYKEYLNNVKLKPGAKKFLSFLKNNGIKVGLATSNCNTLLKVVLNKNKIYNYFDCITRTDEVTRGKNFPDVYLLCAKRLEVNPKNCIVFEDILPAVMGAKKAGMKVVGVHDIYAENQKKDIMNLADFYIFEFGDLPNVV